MKNKTYTIVPEFSDNSLTMYKVLSNGDKSMIFNYTEHTFFAHRMIENGIRLEDCSGVMFLEPKAAKLVNKHFHPSDLDILLMKIVRKMKTKRAEYFFKMIIYSIFAAATLFSGVRVISKYQVSKNENKPNSQQVFLNH